MTSRADRRAACGALWFLVAATTPLPGGASVDRAHTEAAVAAAHPPAASAALTDPLWSGATQASGFFDVTTRTPAPHATRAYLLYDERALYVAFACEQRGVPLVATTTTNDVGGGVDDSVAVLLDTSGVGARTYSFSSTPSAVRYQSSSESTRFRPTWSAYATPTAEGWNALLVIPLGVLRAEAGGKQAWRINFTRHLAATNEDYSWAYEPAATAPTDAVYWPRLTGIALASAATRPKPHADVYALASAGADRKQFQNALGAFETQPARPFGVDATVPFTNTLAFVGTLNPDFSNVEVDQQTIAPQEFRRGLTEYRPFFAQGAKYLDPVSNITINGPADVPFYTPAIGRFDRGFKIEGSAGTQQIGALEARGPGFDDEAIGYGIGRRDHSLAFGASAVLAHHDIGDDVTETLGLSRHNVHSGESTFATMRWERGTFVDNGALARRLQVGEILQDPRTLAVVTYQDIGPEYGPIDGYTRQNDIRGPLALYQFSGVGQRAVKAYSLLVGGDRYVDRSGAARESDAFASASLTFKNLLSLSAGPSTSTLRTYDVPFPVYAGARDFRFDQHSLGFGYRDGTAAPLDGSFAWGPFASYCPPAGPRALFCGAQTGFVQTYLQQFSLTGARTLGPYALGAEFDGTRERPYGGFADGQYLRRLSLTRSLGRDTSVSVALRSINGTGGFAVPGTNLSFALHARFRNQDELFLDFGTPAADRTLNRTILKYVFHVGGGAGT